MMRLSLFVIFFFLIGCVGTVQDSSAPKTVLKQEALPTITFAGVNKAYGIADDKIEVLFYPASGGSGFFDYVVFVGDIAIPYTVPTEVLKADYRGYYKFTITRLDKAQSYLIKMEARDQKTGAKDSNSKTLLASTFNNDVADFMGISTVSNPQGIDGLDSIKVRWSHAYVDFSNIMGNAPSDPKSYEIVAVNADLLTPTDFDDRTKGEAQGRYVKIVDYDAKVNEALIRGLPANKKFFIRVRAIHKASIDDWAFPSFRSEMNNNYLEISTLSNASPLFDTTSVIVSKNEGIAVTSSLKVDWGAVVGVFDHFRIYYGDLNATVNSSVITSTCISGVDVAGVFCKKVNSDLRSTLIANLSPLTTYQVMLVVCQDVACSVGQRVVSDIKTGATTPSLGGFLGINAIINARNVNELGKLILSYSPPDFSLGYFDGFIVAYKQDSGITAPYQEITEITYVGPLTYDPFNYALDSEIVVNNISYVDGALNCFNIYPFVYDNLMNKVAYNSNVWKCVVPEIKAPDKDQFPGLVQGVTSGLSFTLLWNAPSTGVFTDYEIFWKKTPGVFNFSNAINETAAGNYTNYGRSYVNAYQTQFTLNNLPAGDYKIGILTYYANPQTINDGDPSNDIYRSEYNDGVLTCTLAVGQSNTCL